MIVSPKIHMLKIQPPNVLVLGCRAFGGYLGYEGRATMNRMCVLLFILKCVFIYLFGCIRF